MKGFLNKFITSFLIYSFKNSIQYMTVFLPVQFKFKARHAVYNSKTVKNNLENLLLCLFYCTAVDKLLSIIYGYQYCTVHSDHITGTGTLGHYR